MAAPIQVGRSYVFLARRAGAGDYGQDGVTVTALAPDAWSAYDHQRTWQVRLPDGRSLQVLESELVDLPETGHPPKTTKGASMSGDDGIRTGCGLTVEAAWVEQAIAPGADQGAPPLRRVTDELSDADLRLLGRRIAEAGARQDALRQGLSHARLSLQHVARELGRAETPGLAGAPALRARLIELHREVLTLDADMAAKEAEE